MQRSCGFYNLRRRVTGLRRRLSELLLLARHTVELFHVFELHDS